MTRIKKRLIEQVSEERKIHDLLIEFDSIFPHLHEKITSYQEYAHKLSCYAKVYVCREGEGNIGILIFYANDVIGKIAYISLIGVAAEYEGRGVGKCLLDYAIQSSKENGMLELKLEVDLDNERAIAFYKSNGFIICSNETKASMYMTKQLEEKQVI